MSKTRQPEPFELRVRKVNDNSKIKILLADDHEIMRDGLKALLNDCPGMRVVGEAGDAAGAERVAHEVKPDVITIGVNIAGANGIDTVRKFAHEFPNVKIVAHSVYLEKAFVAEMLKAGTSAYVHKEHAFAALVTAINAAAHNEVYLCPKVANVVMNGYLNNLSHNGSAEVCLTNRERQVLKLLADGKSSKQIALELYVSVKTVDTHRRQIMNKLKLYSLPELTKYAIRCGMTSIN